jgi:hypothetical protein
MNTTLGGHREALHIPALPQLEPSDDRSDSVSPKMACRTKRTTSLAIRSASS